MFRASVAATAWSDNKDSVTTASRECWRRDKTSLRLRHAPPARGEPPRIPEETVPETRKQRNSADAPERRTQQDDADDPKGYRRFFDVEAPRRLGRFAVHERAPKSLRTHSTRVAPVEVGLTV